MPADDVTMCEPEPETPTPTPEDWVRLYELARRWRHSTMGTGFKGIGSIVPWTLS